uniref:RING-type E3 ubiquitin transferase n=1 Tax=Hucho hucho TaxID=62062 RepID=A0A4W5QXD5_9TELE
MAINCSKLMWLLTLLDYFYCSSHTELATETTPGPQNHWCAFGLGTTTEGGIHRNTGRGMPPVSEMEMAAPEGGVMGGLSRADCLCPVCLEIFLEPVTLPCSHTFCKPCFLETVDKANLCCPLCRKRVSTWARLNGRNKTLVNDELWQRVQAAFPMQCQRRLSGQEEEDENILVPGPKVSLPGEVRREYEDQISKILEEKRALEEAERKASEEYIQCLLADEEERLEVERRRDEERQLENDNKLARLLSQELNPILISESQKNTRTNDITPAKKKRNTNAGDIEKFLSPIPQRHNSNSEISPTSSFMANKENILHSKSKPWSSKEPAEHPMPSLEFYPESYHTPCEASTSSESMVYHLTVPSGTSLARTPLHGTPKRGVTSAKRKSCDIVEPNEGEADVVSKRLCPSSSSSLHAADRGEVALEGLGEKALLLQELAQREEVLFSRMQQEQEDRQLAFQLQRQLDREEAIRAVDRSKGSSDQYQLRQKPDSSSSPEGSGHRGASRGRSRTSTETRNTVERRRLSGPSSTTNKGERSSTISSAAATTSRPLKRGSKQATLTEMFPSLGS